MRGELQAQASSPDQTIARMAAAAVSELDNRIAGISQLSSGAMPAGARIQRVTAHAADARQQRCKLRRTSCAEATKTQW